ncbi:MAG: triose-phosphate isomerase [Gammaproteobacteria bacterium]|jgi:triosephosphate isomerase|nr:triose-phosphate isomerase [Gammaproteobacteria bacterium]
MSGSTVPGGRRPRPVVANWKMYGDRRTLAAWAQALEERLGASPTGPVVVCPPFPYLLLFAGVRRYALGAQDVADEEDGAYTGCVSAAMLRDCGCRYVIVGHSERRTCQGERDPLIARKVARALAAGLRPIVCLGESQAERDAGRTEEVLLRALEAVLGILGPPGAESPELHLAYEPLWAIGSGRPAGPEDVASVHALLRRRLRAHDAKMADRTPILYGGSVRAPQARELRALEDVDGLLVGGASRDVDEFHAICRAWHDREWPQD